MSGGGIWPFPIFEEPTIEKSPLFAGIIIE